jgi:hypothetical protein
MQLNMLKTAKGSPWRQKSQTMTNYHNIWGTPGVLSMFLYLILSKYYMCFHILNKEVNYPLTWTLIFWIIKRQNNPYSVKHSFSSCHGLITALISNNMSQLLVKTHFLYTLLWPGNGHCWKRPGTGKTLFVLEGKH